MELKMEAFNGEWKFNHLGNLYIERVLMYWDFNRG